MQKYIHLQGPKTAQGQWEYYIDSCDIATASVAANHIQQVLMYSFFVVVGKQQS